MTENQEPRDVESRLRASLHAYADAVGDEPVPRAPVAGARTGPAAPRPRGWRVPALVAAAVLAVAGGGWFVTAATSTPSPTAAPAEQATVLGGDSRSSADLESAPDSSPRSSAAAADAQAGPAGQLVVPPPAEVGVPYPFDLYTHCGILGADVAGVWFAAESPLVEEFGPPAGWDDPYQRGLLTLGSTDQAVFRDDAGHEVSLRAAEAERPPPCA